MIFNWIEQELSEGEPWSIFLNIIPYPEEDIFDFWETETHLDRYSGHASMHPSVHLRHEPHHRLAIRPDSAVKLVP